MVTVLLAHESRLVRQALAKILSIQDGVTVVGYADTGPDVSSKIDSLSPDVLVVDSTLPGLNGMINKNGRETADDTMIVTPAADPGRRGDTSFLSYDDNLGELVGAVINAGGERSRSKHIYSKGKGLSTLTEREREILKLVADGLSNRQISQDMYITERTVKYHMSNILRKLDLFSRTEAAILFLKGDLSGGVSDPIKTLKHSRFSAG